MKRTITIVLMAFALLVTACGSTSDDDSAEAPPDPATDVVVEGPVAAEGGEVSPSEPGVDESSEETMAAAEQEASTAGEPAASGDPFAAAEDLDTAVQAYLDAVESLSTELLEPEEAAALHSAARAVLEAIWSADLDAAWEAIDAMQSELGDRLQNETLSEGEAAAVIEALLFLDEILDEIDATIAIPIVFPPYTPECEELDGSLPHADVWVDAAADAGGDGSVGSPLRAIGDALDEHAGEPVTVHVAPGTYTEDLSISGDTRILADAGAVLAGTITNAEPRLLEVHILAIEGRGAAPASIDVQHPCAATVIDGVSIHGSVGAAVRHNGGSAHLTDVRVTNSSSPDGSPALIFENGAQATLDNVSVAEPVTGALLVRDGDTVVTASRLRVTDSGVGAVEVADNALLRAVFVTITGSRFFGIEASSGGAVFGSAVSVSGVVGTEMGADALAARSGGVANIRHFELLNAQRCGVTVDGSIDLVWGGVHFNQIGACVVSTGYDLERLRQCVVYSLNGVNLQASTLPIANPAQRSSLVESTCPSWVTEP